MSTHDQWSSFHVHYNSDPHWLLKEAVTPMVQTLRTRRLIDRYFFIRYWEQGPHIRLRFLATNERSHSELTELVKDAINDFLHVRPSVFRFPTRYMPPSFSRMFVAEYGEQQLTEKYGESGQIPYAANNHIVSAPYIPEDERYGGKSGVTIAETHFEMSSDYVLRALAGSNGHDFRVILGNGYRLMLYCCMILMEDRHSQLRCLENYQNHWSGLVASFPESVIAQLETKYLNNKHAIDRNTEECISSLEGHAEGSATDRFWIEHLRSIRCKLGEAFAAKELQLPPQIRTEKEALDYLIPSYMHMTNNRFGISIFDEMYLAYIMRRSMEERYA